ncbi:hypothetical protein [Salinimonas iocasae]|uniref:Uncharacterized protein n=1 Tax=Salinimonas iocasae TaxID=2572577 RepID=A0A5B7Y946_9ALTE|nr:hypothetical protein [Salinimonas iocasae]QCZ92184.1 hypothetical protein FBQ74_01255 [Salinimonas iocasae]
MNTYLLSTEQLQCIAIAIHEDASSNLCTDDVREIAYQCLDNIAGFESLSEQQLQRMVELIINHYFNSIRNIKK